MGLIFATGLFILRVFAQLTEYFIDVPFIPDYENWHSATVPYGFLLSIQLVIIWVMIRFCARIYQGVQVFSKRKGHFLVVLGFIYLSSMIIRNLLGLTIYAHIIWFNSYLPIVFHYILSLFVIGAGYMHVKNSTHLR
jgi:hypothetical protein